MRSSWGGSASVSATIRDEQDFNRLAEVAGLTVHHRHRARHPIHGETIARCAVERTGRAISSG